MKKSATIFNCLKISPNVIRVVYHVISGNVHSIHVKWHMCPYFVPLMAQVVISQLKIVITVRKRSSREVPLIRIQI